MLAGRQALVNTQTRVSRSVVLGPSQRCSGGAGAGGQDRFHADAAAQREEHAAAQRNHAHLQGGKVGRWALSGRVEGTHPTEAEPASASSPPHHKDHRQAPRACQLRLHAPVSTAGCGGASSIVTMPSTWAYTEIC